MKMLSNLLSSNYYPMKNNIYLLLLLCIIVISCKEKDKTTNEATKFYEEKGISFDKQLEYCIILPEVGCIGCIASGVGFFLNNKDFFLKTQKKNFIVFTAVNSKKQLFRTLELTSLADFNCYLDLENNYLVGGNNSIYPLVLHLKNGKIIKAEYQSPYSENILEQLEKDLTK